MRKNKIKKPDRRQWSEEEIKLLKQLFPRGRARKIAERIGRSVATVRQKAYSMGIKTDNRRIGGACLNIHLRAGPDTPKLPVSSIKPKCTKT